MRRFPIFFIVAFSIIPSLTFSQDDHLEPIRDFNKEGLLRNYYDGISKLLQQGLSETPIARYTVLPSFSPEYILSVEKDSEGKYLMVYQVGSDNYWYAKNKSNIKLTTFSKTIESDFAVIIKKLYDVTISQIKQPSGSTMGLDGVTYFFSTINNQGTLITGEKWSPKTGSRMDRLVQINEDLVLYTQGKLNNPSKIVENINKLLVELK